ncbi:MAG: N-acetylglucosamine-6-phosphate deacetylase, partial [Acidimicrobiales bacterium]
MSRIVTLAGGQVATPLEILRPGYVRVDVDEGVIDSIGAGVPGEPSARGRDSPVTIDVGDYVIAPGFVDVHVHGGGGDEVNGDDPAEVLAALRRIAAFHAKHGTTSIVATTVSDSPAALSATVQGIAAATRESAVPFASWGGAPRVLARRRRDSGGAGGVGAAIPDTPGGAPCARVLGSHLEGPFIARAKLGAQDPAAARRPDLHELASLLEQGDGTVRIMTIAPELPRALDAIAIVERAGVVPAVGHTDASFEMVERAISAGASHLTHAFNAMPPLHHRRPGPLGAAFASSDMTIELIADLQHIHPVVLAIAARLAPERVVAVSDAVAAAGLGPGRYEVGRLEVTVTSDGSRVTLAGDDTTLAGSLLTLDRALANLMEVTSLDFLQALQAVTLTPARSVLGTARVGRLAAGCAADLVLLDPKAHFGVAST